MLLIYLKIAWRNIWRQKGLSLINICGLSVSITAFILLSTYIRHEASFDRFHPKGENTYRVVTFFGHEASSALPRTLPGIAQLLDEQFPEVTRSVRIKPEAYKIRINDRVFEHEDFLMTDPSFQEIFHFPVLAGNLSQTLSDPSSVALTHGLANKLFGHTDVIDKTIEVEQYFLDTLHRRLNSRFVPLRIGALLLDPPTHTHLQFSALQGYESYDRNYSRTFSNDILLYFQTLHPLTDQQQEAIRPALQDHIAGIFGENYRDALSHEFQPLHEIHFGPGYGYDMGQRGNKTLIYIFAAVALFILFISVINFINLVTARSEKRAVEAAIRKVSGAGRAQIIRQFMGEAIMVCCIALLLALVMAELLMNPFASLLNRKLSLFGMMDLPQLLFIVAFAPIIGMLAGAYPSIVFSRFQPVEILRGKARGGNKAPLLRIILVIIQFTISVVLIVSVMVFNRQTQYMKNADLGFSSRNIIVVSGLTDRIIGGFESIKSELLSSTAIEGVSSSQAFPGTSGSGMSLRKPEDPETMSISSQEYRIGKDFQTTYGIRLKHGRWFDFDDQSDLQNFILNETAVKALGLHQPLGEEIVMWRRNGRIIGVVEDFHTSSLKNQIEPLVISAYAQSFYHIAVKLSYGREEEALAHIGNTLEAFDPNFVFREWYLENHFRNMYRQEENNNTILNFASLLAIIIAMLGILGLSSYVIMARTREIGVRKILGARTFQIIRVLFTDIIKWVLLASIIASPIAWYLMERWLEAFPYRISMSVIYLISAAAISILIVMVTVSWQTFRAARRNPVDAIKAQ
ncbi:MAG: ABC transporter permease [Bacteroidetes bacterium]|nr:MAG: ABC transporter permease [Bacteroidota bacterium]